MTFENIIAFIKKHKAMLGLGAIGLEIAFLMLVIGFFRTLLHKKSVRIFEQTFHANKAKIRRCPFT